MKATVFRLRAPECVHRALIFVKKTEERCHDMNSKFEPEKPMIKAAGLFRGWWVTGGGWLVAGDG